MAASTMRKTGGQLGTTFTWQELKTKAQEILKTANLEAKANALQEKKDKLKEKQSAHRSFPLVPRGHQVVPMGCEKKHRTPKNGTPKNLQNQWEQSFDDEPLWRHLPVR